jgi:putative oxidoreductase
MKKIFNKLTTPITMPYWWQDLLIAIPRIVCGYLLAAEFGAQKFGLPWSPADNNLHFFEVAYWFPKQVESFGGIFKMFPAFFAWMGAFSEAVGGIFLVIGFQTRFFSFLAIITMLVAAFCVQWQHGLWNMLSALGIMWVYVYTLIIGSGRFGIDYLIFKKFNNEK